MIFMGGGHGHQSCDRIRISALPLSTIEVSAASIRPIPRSEEAYMPSRLSAAASRTNRLT